MFEALRARVTEVANTVSTIADTVSRAVDAARGVLPQIAYSALGPYGPYDQFGGIEQKFHTGSKFEGGFGATQLVIPDYWTLRMRSRQLFKTNLYARGLIRRLVTNEIAVGLHLEATPVEKVLGMPEDSLAEWSEDVETRFSLWQSDPWLCDHTEQQTFGQIQIQARMESLIEGDILCVLRQFQPTQLPRVQLIMGSAVQSPTTTSVKLPKGHTIVHGVQLDAQKRHVGYWIVQADGTSQFLPAWGEKSGRRIAWLVYGTEKKYDDVRGEPLLSLVLQSLREIDRYRDSTQRKAVINSMLAMFVKKTVDKLGSRPITNGAVKKGAVGTPISQSDAAPPLRRFNVAELIPGLVIDELNPGEEPAAFPSHGTDEKFGDFERAIIQAIAWAYEIPPEILMLSFSSNYSASQAALNEFKIYLSKVRTIFGDNFCTVIYQQWLLSMALAGRVQAAGLLESWRDSKRYETFSAWVSSDWSGNIKPSIDLPKLVAGYKALVAEGWITRDRASRELTGTKYSQNVKKLRLENAALVECNEVLKELDPKFAAIPDEVDGAEANDAADAAEEAEGSRLRMLAGRASLVALPRQHV
jgi:capsid protein